MCVGFLLSLRCRNRYSLIYLIIGFHIFVAALFGGFSRYRIPIDPLLIIFAALSISSLFEKVKEVAIEKKVIQIRS